MERGICPECQTSRHVQERRGERVCTQCGYVLGDRFIRAGVVPGRGSQTYVAPEGPLSFGNDQGNPSAVSKSDQFALHNVLKQAGTENLGLRVLQTKAECALAQECSRLRAGTVTRRMKDIVSNLMKDHGFRDDVILAHRVGRNLNWVGGLLDMIGDGRHGKRLASSLLVLAVQTHYNSAKAEKLMNHLRLKTTHLAEAKRLLMLRTSIWC